MSAHVHRRLSSIIITLIANRSARDLRIVYPIMQRSEAVELLVVLQKSSAPLGLYELLMKWNFVYMQRVKCHQPVSESLHYFSRETLYKYLFSRYHMDPKKYNIERRITLPGSAANVNIIHHDAVFQFESLLTDPRRSLERIMLLLPSQ